MPDDARGAAGVDSRPEALYEPRANEWPRDDPEAELRLDKALRAADLVAGERLLDLEGHVPDELDLRAVADLRRPALGPPRVQPR